MSPVLRRLLVEPAPLAWIARQTWHVWCIVGLVCIGAFVGQLDATIVQLALPALSRTFDASLQEVSWVALSYLLAFASFLPIFGRLCEILGRKSLYILGYMLFVAASALCGLATSFEQLVLFRVLQGIGGALLGANSISLLLANVPLELRGRAFGYFAAAQAIGMSAGPALGGLLLESFGWRWIFWVTVPFGVVAAVVGWLALPKGAGRGEAPAFDWGGALLIGPALVLLITALNHASSWGVISLRVLGCLFLAALLFLLLARHEAMSRSPLINPVLFKSLRYCCGAVAVSLGYALLYGVFFLMSFALEHGYGENPSQAGLRLAIVPIAIGLSAPFSHDIARWLGHRRIGIASMALCAAGAGMLTYAVSHTAHHHVLDTAAFLVFGVGLGLFVAPNNTATIAAVDAKLSSAAGSLLNLMRVLGTSLGVAFGASVLAWRLDLAQAGRGSWMSAGTEVLLGAVGGSLPGLVVLAACAAVAARMATEAWDSGQG